MPRPSNADYEQIRNVIANNADEIIDLLDNREIDKFYNKIQDAYTPPKSYQWSGIFTTEIWAVLKKSGLEDLIKYMKGSIPRAFLYWQKSPESSLDFPAYFDGEIDSLAFAYCSGLTTVTLKGITEINNEAFFHCVNLYSVSLGNKL